VSFVRRSRLGLSDPVETTRPRLRCHQKLSADTGWIARDAMLVIKQIQHKASAAMPLLPEDEVRDSRAKIVIHLPIY